MMLNSASANDVSGLNLTDVAPNHSLTSLPQPYLEDSNFDNSLETYRANSCESCLNVKDFGAMGWGRVHDDTPAIQAAINAATDGQTIFFPHGRYLIRDSLTLKSNTILLGYRATLVSDSLYSVVIKNQNINNFSVVGLSFENIIFTFGSSNGVRFFYSHFSNGLIDPSSSNSEDTLYLHFGRSSDILVKNSSFIRGENYIGRGVRFWKSQDATIQNSRFLGYFKTAINIQGADGADNLAERSQRILIDNNTIIREPFTTLTNACPSAISCRNLEGTNLYHYFEDHGIYAWGFHSLVIRKNYIKGWSLSPYGGALKLRNADQLFVLGNELINSGILLYTYTSDNADINRGYPVNEPSFPIHLNVARIFDNRVDLTKVFGSWNVEPQIDKMAGISYWRNFCGGNRLVVKHEDYDSRCATSVFESDLNFARNRIKNGNLIINEPAQIGEFNLISNEINEIRAPDGWTGYGNNELQEFQVD